MILGALVAVILATLIALDRRPLMVRADVRLMALCLAGAAFAAAAYDTVRGGLGAGLVLAVAGLWIAASTRRPKLPAADGMGVAEAATMLGVAPDADREEIEAAYRRLMFRVHPDQGGAAGLAAQINAARAVLLGRR
jgi:hypothetical protein